LKITKYVPHKAEEKPNIAGTIHLDILHIDY